MHTRERERERCWISLQTRGHNCCCPSIGWLSHNEQRVPKRSRFLPRKDPSFFFSSPILFIEEKGGDVLRAEGQSPVPPIRLLRRQLGTLQECSPTLLLLDSLQLALTQALPQHTHSYSYFLLTTSSSVELITACDVLWTGEASLFFLASRIIIQCI